MTAAILAVLVALGLGFGGRWLPAFDAFAHFRAHLAVLGLALGCVAFGLRRVVAGVLVLGASGISALTVAPYLLPNEAPRAPDAPGPSYTLLQMNLLYRASDPDEAIRRIAEARPDVITVEELTPRWTKRLEILSDTYPYRFYCGDPGRDWLDAGILSRRPFVEGDEGVCDRDRAFVARQVDFNGVPVTIAAHHQLWPWPWGQWRRLEGLEPKLRQLSGPVLMAGDFNAAPWSALIAAYAETANLQVVEGIGPTWRQEDLPSWSALWNSGLAIDNVLHSPDVTIREVHRLAPTTSDHLPVLVTFTVQPPPSAPDAAVAGLSGPAVHIEP